MTTAAPVHRWCVSGPRDPRHPRTRITLSHHGLEGARALRGHPLAEHIVASILEAVDDNRFVRQVLAHQIWMMLSMGWGVDEGHLGSSPCDCLGDPITQDCIARRPARDARKMTIRGWGILDRHLPAIRFARRQQEASQLRRDPKERSVCHREGWQLVNGSTCDGRKVVVATKGGEASAL